MSVTVLAIGGKQLMCARLMLLCTMCTMSDVVVYVHNVHCADRFRPAYPMINRGQKLKADASENY